MNYIFTSQERIDEIKKQLSENLSFKKELTALAEKYRNKPPLSVTYHKSPAESGNIHDYFSEGLYWWPDPENPDGPYIRRDGEPNPNVFKHHRDDLTAMSQAVCVLAQAGLFLENEKYFEKAAELINVWFINEETKMNPHLEYAQAIRGICSGRGIGIIDTTHFISVILGADILEKTKKYDDTVSALKKWFSEYTKWLNTSEKGLEEKNYFNNHSNWWVAQVASFCAFTGDDALLTECFDKFKKDILPNQIDEKGRFADEITRTLSFTYTVYNMTACAITCEIAAGRGIDLWNFTAENGNSVKKCVEYFMPFYEDFNLWEYKQIKKTGCELEKLPMRLAQLRYKNSKLAEINEKKRATAIPCSQITHLGVLDLV